MTHFPIFIDMRNLKVLIVGGGNVACRRVNILKNFGADITLITNKLKKDIKDINIIIKDFEGTDVTNKYDMVIATTNDKALNHNIIKKAKEIGIKYYNNAGDKNDNNFYFPAIVENDDILCGLISKAGSEHKLVKYYKDKITGIL